MPLWLILSQTSILLFVSFKANMVQLYLYLENYLAKKIVKYYINKKLYYNIFMYKLELYLFKPIYGICHSQVDLQETFL